jgi:CheY-like chemotaxis protein
MSTKLLIADDSATVQKVVGLAFSDENVEIESVSSGDAAMDSIRNSKPDIVLADIAMPNCNGYELCEWIKNDPILSDLPVILLAGTLEPLDEAVASRVKCDGHLTKPFDTSELIQTVHSLVKDKTMLSQSDASMNPAVEPEGIRDENRNRSRVWNSFLGEERILDLFDPETLASAESFLKQGEKANEKMAESLPLVFHPPMMKDLLSEEFISSVADKVARRLSPEVIREVAWEVVPELSEVLIRRVIEEQNKS